MLPAPRIPRRLRLPLVLLAPVLGVVAALVAFRPAPPPPALVILVTVDQMRGDYLARWSGQWTGAFRRLEREAAVFPEGRQDHGLTETAPGHATLLSGREPAGTGIVTNGLGVGDSSVRLLGTTGGGASPWRFRGPTLVDWLRKADSGTRVLSVSAKDRAAILPIGKTRASVVWYSDGRFTTSSYYRDTLPEWVEAWNARGGVAAVSGRPWRLLLPDSAYPEPDSVPRENHGKDFTFPHVAHEPVAEGIKRTPWVDSLILDLALAGVRALDLGRRARPDLLAVSLSGTDYIGHAFGPDSREVHDHLLHVDRWLGQFLDSLEARVGKGRVFLVLSADHGVTPFPELTQARGRDAGYLRLGALIREVNRQLAARHSSAPKLVQDNGLVFADREQLREAGVSPESLATALAAQAWRLPGVADAWTPATLGAAVPVNVHARRWARQLPRDFSWLLAVQARPGWVYGDGPTGGAEHGTTNDDDAGVPVIFLGPGIPAGIFPDTVRTVDIAPTLASLLGLKPEGRLDGRPIRRLTR